MKKMLSILMILLTLFSAVSQVYAIYDPKVVPNNKFGIHILFPSEIPQAARLINSSGGDWGYVVIPLQYQDRDLEKWQKFLDDCQTYHVIPIIRLSTEGYWKNTNVWRKPSDSDILDLANFLNSLSWPVKNRYIVLFNEMNRSDEWGGEPPSPYEYSDLALYAIEAFKNTNPNFYLILGGLDNASPNDGVKYMDNFVYLREMGKYNPEVFKKADGITSHSYPNPAFAQPPSTTKLEGTSTYIFERELVKSYAGVDKPVFILETGWDATKISQDTISAYYKVATNSWDQDESVMVFTPFLLSSQNGAFDKFSFTEGGSFKEFAKNYQAIPKTKGQPEKTPFKAKFSSSNISIFPGRKFEVLVMADPLSSDIMKSYFKTLFVIGK